MAVAELPPRDGLRYGALGFALAFVALPLYVHLPAHYATQFGVPLASLGALLLAARALGGSSAAIAMRHVLPAVLPVVLATGGIVFGGAGLAEATLSFVGLGAPSIASWGRLIADAGPYLRDAWWLWLFPGLALVSSAVGVGLVLDVS